MSDLRQLEDVNFLGRIFSKLPLLYETKHETFEDKNKKKVVVVVVVSGVVSSVGRLGETWVGSGRPGSADRIYAVLFFRCYIQLRLSTLLR